MKLKLYAILVLFAALHLCLPMVAAAKVAVTDVEYLKGDDFVQLHFKTNKIIPIPDLFYPDEANSKLIVMRITGVQFNLKQKDFNFKSPVIDNVNIKNKEKFSDIEIALKEKVNYRVFTNQQGLFIEFPTVKKIAKKKTLIAKRKKRKSSSTLPTPPIVANKTLSKKQRRQKALTAKNKLDKKIEKKLLLAKKSRAKRIKNEKPLVTGPCTINDFNLAKKSKNQVKFELDMTGFPEYNVIAIPEPPVRLAIDFKATKAKRFKKTIDCLNVKKMRGAFNSPTTYRLVFDLLYLKNYNVSFKDNMMVIEFFDAPHAKVNKKRKEKLNAAKSKKRPIAKGKTPQNKTAKKELIAKNNLKAQPKNIEKKKKDTTKKRKRRNNKNKIILAKKNTNIKTAPPTRKPLKKKKRLAAPSMENSIYMEPSKTDPQPQELTKVSNTIPLKSKAEDFFKEEKSQVIDSSLQLPEDFHAEQDESGGKQINYLRNTIETGKKEYSGEPMDFSFKNAELENVILFFAKVSGLSIVIDPGVTGKITAKMYQVPWDQALEYFLKVNGLDMILEGNLLRIGKVDVLAKEAQARRKLRESRQMEGELEVITRTLSYTQSSQILSILKKQLSQRGEILEDSRTNTLIISEVPEKVNLLDKLIDTLDTANAQVTIEARIVETNSNYTESLGIQWGYGFSADAMYGNQTSLKFPNSVSVYGNQLQSQTSPFIGPLGGYAVNLPATGSNSGMAFSMANVANTFRLDMALSAMESKGKGRIISAPKTTTQNNMEATIMQGKQIPVQTIQNNTVTVQYRPAALELKVTPQITAKGTVICEIDIKNNSADFANLVNGIPPIITQTIKTSVMINDGGTIVIGGMYRVETSQSTAATPFFSKIPILGNLFKNSDKRKEQKELLIFITPRIIK